MRGRWPRAPGDLDVVEVLLVEHGDDHDDDDVAADHVRAVLHELALESIAWRATWPGEPERLVSPEATGDGPERPGLARRIARRYRRRAVTAAVLALAVAVTTVVVDTRRTAARAAALAAMPAVLAEASSPPSEVWRVPGRVVSDQDDRLLVVDGGSLRAVDPATGEVTWTASDAAGRAASLGGCFPVDESLLPDRAPVDDGAGPPDMVACGAGGSSGAAAGAVVVVDSTTGRTRHTVTPDGALLLAEPAGRDLLVAAARTDGRVRVTRWDLATGDPRWDRVSPRPVLTGGPADTVERRPGSLTVAASFAVDLATGDELDAERESGAPYPYQEHLLPTGAHATWSWLDDGTSGRGRGRVLGGSTGPGFMLPGPPLRPAVTDGSDAGVLVVRVVRGDRLRGVDLRTGRMRWSVTYPGVQALRATALVDHVMLLDDGATVTALDVRTGDVAWRAPVDDAASDGAALTDGRVVLLPVRADDGALRLVARRIADGVEVWAVEAPAATVATAVVGHRLVVSTDDEVIGLG